MDDEYLAYMAQYQHHPLRVIPQEINMTYLRDSDEATYYKDNFFNAIPVVDLVKELYQNWIRISKLQQRNTLDLFLTEIFRDPEPSAPANKLKRLAYYLIKAFIAWSMLQDTEGACGNDLFKLDPLQENELYKTVTLLQEVMSRSSPKRSTVTTRPPSSSTSLSQRAVKNCYFNAMQRMNADLERGDTPLLPSVLKDQSRINKKNLGYSLVQSSRGDNNAAGLSNAGWSSSRILRELSSNVSTNKRNHQGSPPGSSTTSPTDGDEGDVSGNESSDDESKPPSVFAVPEM